MTPHSSSIAFLSSTSSSTVILPSVSSTLAVSVAMPFVLTPSCSRLRLQSRRRRAAFAAGSSAAASAAGSSAAASAAGSSLASASAAGSSAGASAVGSSTTGSSAGALRIRRRVRDRSLGCGRRRRPPPRRLASAPDVSPSSSSCSIRASISPTRSRSGAASRPSELRQRRDDHADELALDDLRRRELRELLDVGAGDRACRRGCRRAARAPSCPSPCRRAPSRRRRGRRRSRRTRSRSGPRAARAATRRPPPRRRGA